MSYARWGCDGSEVYIYDHHLGGTVCHACPFSEGNHRCRNRVGMVLHVLRHRLHGHRLRPGLCRDLLKGDG